MSVRITDIDRGMKRLLENIVAMRNAYTTVGVHDQAGSYEDGIAVALVAYFNEFGTENAPERSFLRSTMDENRERIFGWIKEGQARIFAGKSTPEKELRALGFKVSELVKNKIKSNVPPPNAPSTLARKEALGQGTKTLMASKLLLRSIGYEVGGLK